MRWRALTKEEGLAGFSPSRQKEDGRVTDSQPRPTEQATLTMDQLD